jgi:hypothetical protein
VRVVGIFPCFVADIPELFMSDDLVVSSFFCFCVEAWSSFSGHFLFSDFVLADFAYPSPADPFCSTETVCAVFPSTSTTNLDVSGEACLMPIVIPFSIELRDQRLDVRCVQLVLAHFNHTQPEKTLYDRYFTFGVACFAANFRFSGIV